MFRFFVSYFYIILAIETLKPVSCIKILDQGILPLKSESAGVLFYVTVENESRQQPCRVWSRSERCCLKVDLNEDDCTSITLVGGDLGVLNAKEKRNLILVYPTVFQHDKVGSCSVKLLAQCDGSTEVTKARVNIPFDTRVFGPESKYRTTKLFKDYLQTKDPQRCLSLDDDSLNECAPAKCDLKYGGARPYFDRRIRRCVSAPICLRNKEKVREDVVYVPSGNVCRDLEQPITANDLNFISFGSKTTVPFEFTTERSSRIKLICNCSTLSQYMKYLADILFRSDTLDGYQDCHKEATAAMIAVGVLMLTACWQLSLCVGAMLLVIRLREMYLDGSIQTNTSSLVLHFRSFKARMTGKKPRKAEDEEEVTQSLMLNEIKKDTEVDIRQSVSDLCERMSREVGRSRRYRPQDVGSQISLSEGKGGKETGPKHSKASLRSQRQKESK